MKAEITCKCSSCKLSLNYPNPSLSLLCACEDCRKALDWGFTQGGAPPTTMPELFYVRSDIHSFEGLKFMKPFQLRSNARSTRIYCIKCFSILGVDHPGYKDNVFMFFKGFCNTTCDLSITPSAAIYLKDFPVKTKLELPEDIEKVWSFTSEENVRFRSIPEVYKSFRAPSIPARGITFKEMIRNMPETEVLNLSF